MVLGRKRFLKKEKIMNKICFNIFSLKNITKFNYFGELFIYSYRSLQKDFENEQKSKEFYLNRRKSNMKVELKVQKRKSIFIFSSLKKVKNLESIIIFFEVITKKDKFLINCKLLFLFQ